MKSFIFAVAFIFIHASGYSQDTTQVTNHRTPFTPPDPTAPNYDVVSLGIGLGLDFGGIGGNLCVYPEKHLGIFGGAGFALAGVGLNGGLKYRFISEEKFTKWAPYVSAMYGYNAAIVVANAEGYNKLFYGPSFGAGVSFRGGSTKSSGFTFGLLLPVRSASVDKYLDSLRKKGVIFESELLPIGITIGYVSALD